MDTSEESVDLITDTHFLRKCVGNVWRELNTHIHIIDIMYAKFTNYPLCVVRF